MTGRLQTHSTDLMRILFVVPNVPSPVRPRPLHFIRGLSALHDVSVICLATNEVDAQFASELRSHCKSLQVIRLSKWRSLWNCLLALFSATSLRCAYFYSPRLRNKVEAMVEAKEVDLVHAEHLKSLAMVEPVSGKVPVVFDAVDCLSMLESRRRGVTKNPFVKLFAWSEAKKLARAESKAAGLFNRIVISSPVDRRAYPLPVGAHQEIDVVPNGVDLRYFHFRQYEPKKNLLAFCAKLDYFPNEDAALYFSRWVWPLLRARRPELQFQIIGSRPSRTLRWLDGTENIHVIPSVPDMRPYLGGAWIALAPIRIRAGIQNKILEAMALGVPLVATPQCCEGLNLQPGKHLLVADTPEQFASAIGLLLHGGTLRENLIEAGRAYVEREYDWANSVKALSDSYIAAVNAFNCFASRPARAASVPQN